MLNDVWESIEKYFLYYKWTDCICWYHAASQVRVDIFALIDG